MDRDRFPALREDPALVYLDHAATGLLHDEVHEAVCRALARGGSAGRSGHGLGQRATTAYEDARQAVARWFGAPSAEIVFTPSATAGLNLVAAGWGRTHLLPGDRVVVTALDHHAQLLPWREVARETGARLAPVGLTPEGDLDLDDLAAHLAAKPRVVALPHVSNVTGGVVDLGAVIARVRAEVPDCLVVVDGCQAAPHLPPGARWREADFYVVSGHKLGAPTGLGVVWGRAARWPEVAPQLLGGGMVAGVARASHELAEVPWRFEGGTPPHVPAIGLAAALSLPAVNVQPLVDAAVAGLRARPHVSVVGAPARRVGLVSFTVRGQHPHDVATALAERGIAVRAGHLCAQPAVHALGHHAVVRASFGPGNRAADVERLLAAVDGLAEAPPGDRRIA